MDTIDIVREKIIEKIKKIYDPEIPVDIYNLGLIYGLELEEVPRGISCRVLMTFTSPNCPVADYLISSMNKALLSVEEIAKTSVVITFDPPWGPDQISPLGKELLSMENVHFD